MDFEYDADTGEMSFVLPMVDELWVGGERVRSTPAGDGDRRFRPTGEQWAVLTGERAM